MGKINIFLIIDFKIKCFEREYRLLEQSLSLIYA